MSESPEPVKPQPAQPPPAQPPPAEPQPAPTPAPAINPIAERRKVRRFEFLHHRPGVHANVALVFTTLRKGLIEFPPGHVPTMGELLWSGFRTVYEVDMGLHHASIRAELPSADEAFAFQAAIDIQWRVQNAQRVVTNGIKDVRKTLAPDLVARLRKITRRYAIEAAANAEDAANKELECAPIGDDFGLKVIVFVRLAMDTATREDAANMRGVQRYRDIINAGNTDQFAMLLSQNPHDSTAVLGALIEDHDNNRRLTADFITKLIESGAIDRWEIDEQVRATLNWLKESTDRVIKPPEDARPLISGSAEVIQAPPASDGAKPGADTTQMGPDGV